MFSSTSKLEARDYTPSSRNRSAAIEDFLQNVSKWRRGESPVSIRPVYINYIHQVLTSELGGKLQDNMFKTLGFYELQWFRALDQHSDDQLILGMQNEGEYPQNALGTIHLMRQNQQDSPFTLRIAGVTKDSKNTSRVVAFEYHGYKKGEYEVTDFDFSVTGEEDRKLFFDVTKKSRIPSDVNMPYHTEAFITEGMAAQTEHRHVTRISNLRSEGTIRLPVLGLGCFVKLDHGAFFNRKPSTAVVEVYDVKEDLVWKMNVPCGLIPLKSLPY